MAQMNFLFVDGSPVHVMVGYYTTEELQACVNLENRSVTVVLNGRTLTVRLK